MKHLRGGDYVLPNVSYIESSNRVLFNPHVTLGADAFKMKFKPNSFNRMPFDGSFNIEKLLIDNEIINVENDIEGEKIINCINKIEENNITCLSSEISINEEVITVPSEYFVNNPSSFTLKPLDSNFYDENAYIILLLNVPEMGSVAEYVPIMDAIEMGLCTYNKEDNSIIASELFLQILNSEMPYPLCVVLAIINFDTHEFNFIDTEFKYTNSNISLVPIEQMLYTASIPSEYYVFNPTYYSIKPIDESINPMEKYLVICTNEYGIIIIDFMKNYINNYINYNSTTNEIEIINFEEILFYNRLFLKIDNSSLFCVMLCDINPETFAITKVYDTIIKTDGKINKTITHVFNDNKEHNIEFIMKDKTQCPLFTLKSGVSEIYIPETVTTIRDFAFMSTNIETIVIPNSVTDIGVCVFNECTKLKNITLSENITTLDNDGDNLIGFFTSCSSLETITLPKNINYVGGYCFSNCSSLSSIRCESTTAPKLRDSETTFMGIPSTGTLYYPAGSDYSTWKANLPGWTYVEF